MNISAIRYARLSCFVGAIAAICVFTVHAQAQVIYQDDFSGSGSADLGSTVPDVSPTGAENWITAFSRANGGSDNNAAQIFNADGIIFKDGDNATHDAGALLPFEIEANNVYTLEATFLNNNNAWVAVGFATSDATLDGVNGRHSNGRQPNGSSEFGGYAWVLSRNNTSDDNQQFFNGIGTNPGPGGGDFGNPTEEITITIVLDTADEDAITAAYFINGTQIGATQTLNDEAIDDINFVGISSDGSNGSGIASISSFSLTAGSDSEVLLGDADCNGVVNFLDITPFIAFLSGGEPKPEADIDGNGVVNFLDITPFIAIITAP